MIISFKLIAAAVVLGICGVSTSGVMAQQPTPSTVRVIRYEGDITMSLAALRNAYGVTVGLELDTERYHQVNFSLLDATVTDVMNAIVQSSKKYQWRQTGGLSTFGHQPEAIRYSRRESVVSTSKTLARQRLLINC